ncbi:hypothetical protein AV530_017227 [Patagioenas fasciata monilis]|uniref:Uncharacterized protein n=1 Tax=Patagioenas fasciata monilis TaxID=372326 RepID=A0A1V4JFG4_PATFA|nr:hypothetical protein AV530_017227 [Patagioenas fasciata monilis]
MRTEEKIIATDFSRFLNIKNVNEGGKLIYRLIFPSGERSVGSQIDMFTATSILSNSSWRELSEERRFSNNCSLP